MVAVAVGSTSSAAGFLGWVDVNDNDDRGDGKASIDVVVAGCREGF